MGEKELLEHLNKFTRKELSAEEVYIFPVTLCDNEIDRDNERFSVKALEKSVEKSATRSENEAAINRVLMLKNPDGTAKKLFDSIKDSLGDDELEELRRNFSVSASEKSCDEYKM